MSAKPSGNHFVQTAVVHWGCRTRPLGTIKRTFDGLAERQFLKRSDVLQKLTNRVARPSWPNLHRTAQWKAMAETRPG